MKKKITLAILLFLFFSIVQTSNVQALTDSFYEAEYISNAYIKKFKAGSTTGKYQQMRVFRRKSDGKVAYCIELWETIKTEQEINGYQENYETHTNLDSKIWERVELIAYYGYGYQSHQSLDWYAATQYLIWKTLEPESTIYFTETLNGNKIEKYNYEISEINRLVNEHYKKPSFISNKVTLEKTESLKLIDLNSTLADYDIILNPKVTVLKNSMEQSIQIFPKEYGKTKVEFIKKDRFNEPTTVYISKESQNLLVPGTYKPLKLYMDVYVIGGEITITKLDEYTNEKFSYNPELVLEATYQVLDEENNRVAEIEINNQQNPNSSAPLPYGTYKVKEIKCSKGYQLDTNIYQVTISEENQIPNLILKNKPYQTLLKIHKQYGNSDTNIYYDESGAVFEIYNDFGFYKTITTSNLGTTEIILPYGTYHVRQINGMKFYDYIEPKEIEIDETTEETIKWNLKNNETGYYLKIIKKDKDTKNNIISDNSQFKIKNMQTGEYVKSLSGNEIWSTENGYFKTDKKLQSGKYQIIEIKCPHGYEIKKEPIEFEIPLKNKIDTIELIIENKKILGNILIEKLGEKSIFENDTFDYEYVPLENVEFSVYSAELKRDELGNIIQEEDQLLEILKTNKDGTVKSKSLPYGKYYVIESNNIEGYSVDNNKYYVEIKENGQLEKLSFQNNLLKQDIEIIKIDKDTEERLEGARFGLYDENKIKIGESVTDSNGQSYFYQIPLGNYYILELESPKNYYKNEVFYPIYLEKENMFQIIVPNEKIEPIPNTIIEKQLDTILIYPILLLYSLLGYLISRKY
ncbi:MAG: hypothetical protein E7168_00885 [Firmicutes bacterium]|nr:hypothetical protein [Bacillota bacterium]